MSVVDNIVSIAKSYIGQKEVPPNKSFVDKVFLKKMQSVGWLTTQSWCAYFAKLIWVEAYQSFPDILAKIKKNCVGGAMNTLDNFKADKAFVVNMTPVVGSLIIFREGNTWHGHEGVVVEVSGDGSVKTVEGNTNASGGREGIEVALKIRKLNKPYDPKGLNIAGFIHPIAA